MKLANDLKPFRILKVIVLFLFFLVSLRSYAVEKIGIMMLDSAVDHQHSQLSQFVDPEVLNYYSISLENSESTTLKDLNDRNIQEFRDRYPEALIRRQMDLMDRMQNKNDFGAALGASFEILGKSVKPNWKKTLEKVGTYVHGTHVAGILVKDLSPEQVSLINIPILKHQDAPRVVSTLEDLQNLLDLELNDLHQLIDVTSQIIQNHNVKVVNMSIGVPLEESTHKLLRHASRWNRITHPQKVERIVQRAIARYVSEFERLIHAHPETVFVLAAGNERANLNTEKGCKKNLFSKLRAKNVLFVGALDKDGKLARFSNYGPDVVDLAAPGVSIESARIGGGSLHAQGTSMAAPRVANKIIQVIAAHPELDTQEAIQYLLKQETKSRAMLTNKVKNNRALVCHEDRFADIFNVSQFDDETIKEMDESLTSILASLERLNQ